ncbi:amidohydrolase family protein [Paenibacillus thalictri]|uniref:Uncharacterized protein n=1 Tax=Paenibacillus thalictri TaxID=2527873 RepID=A0A4V2J4C6_9BACL|nr:amidohydrolase family protein [Paenibacillus thalictri]TBL79102.1 hypothetical protein EYB31_12855 [Paenibacillus thalictri]
MSKRLVIDAYAHIGLPRFGSADDAIRHMDTHGIDRSVVTLGPKVPDIASLLQAIRQFPDRLRGIGIPFGATSEERQQLVQIQLDGGAIGIRLDKREALDNPGVLELIGERGRWAYGIDPCHNGRTARVYVEWLNRYPQARLAAPHFLKAGFDPDDVQQAGPEIRELLRHERFYGILSRHGAMGSKMVYPHRDFVPWLRFIMEHMDAKRLLWGSEYPVLYWRNETVDEALEWLRHALPELSADTFHAYCGANAAVLFADMPASSPDTAIPVWVAEQFEYNRPVPLFPRGLDMPVHVYAPLMEQYLLHKQTDSQLRFADFVLSRSAGLKPTLIDIEGS